MNNVANFFTEKLSRTAEGLEAQFGVDHLAHFLLASLLLPRLRQAVSESEGVKARVIAVSSAAYKNGRIRWDDPNYEKRPEEYRKLLSSDITIAPIDRSYSGLQQRGTLLMLKQS